MRQDQQAVRDALDALSLAIHAKDARAAIATYADDVTVYDLAPPLVQLSAMVRDRAALEQWFATWDGPVRIDTDDMRKLPASRKAQRRRSLPLARRQGD